MSGRTASAVAAALFVAIAAAWLFTLSRGCTPGERWDKWREHRQERRESIDNQEHRHPWRERFRRRFES